MSDTVTLKRLAKELNLATSTVSRALRDSYEISTSTKERVFSLARKLNYIPNPYAGSLRLKKSKTIAVIIPEITNNFFSLAINGIEDVTNEEEYHVLIYLTHDDHKKELSLVQRLKNGRIDGILMSLAATTKQFGHIADAMKEGIPIVFFDRVCDEIEAPKVVVNNYEGGYKATEHLIKNGCTRIAYLSTDANLYISQKRMLGYRKALDHYKIEYDPALVVQFKNKNKNDESDRQLLYKLLEGEKHPDGIFASVERLAIRSYHACYDMHLKIPDQVKIICFANLETASLLNPSLTTMTQPAYDIGREAAMLLLKLIDKKHISNMNKQVVFRTTLMERNSTSNNTLRARL